MYVYQIGTCALVSHKGIIFYCVHGNNQSLSRQYSYMCLNTTHQGSIVTRALTQLIKAVLSLVPEHTLSGQYCHSCLNTTHQGSIVTRSCLNTRCHSSMSTHTNSIHASTRVYSWNTYPAHLSVRCQIDSACIFVYGSTSCAADCNYHVRI